VPKLAANLKFLFNEFGFPDRFAVAAQAGFKGVEFQSPYDYDTQMIRQELAEHSLEFVLLNLPSGSTGGYACDPTRTAEFEQGVARAIDVALAVGCARANCIAGVPPPGLDARDAHTTFVRNLKYAASQFKAAGLTLVIEAINTRDIPGFFLNDTAQAVDIIRQVGADNLKFQYDMYHMQIMQGDQAPTIERHLAHIGHMQLADTPGRHEPGSGEINYPFLLDFLDRVGYTGWIGCEYVPATTTLAGLGWAAPYLKPQARQREGDKR
jgi:hydroxypyruvate isomerase